MKISRKWNMPNHETFSVPAIRDFISPYVGNGIGWVDPFARNSSLCEITNDVNPSTSAKFHLPAIDFLRQLNGEYDGCLFDPPYSLRQVKECYEGIGREFTHFDSTNSVRWTVERDCLAGKIKAGGKVISFGWSTTCMGKKRNFEIINILIVSHGPAHNDTLITVEVKK